MDRRSPARKAAGLLFLSLVLCSAAAIAAPGDPLGPQFRVNVHQSDNQHPQSVTAGNSGFRVYWTSDDGGYANNYLTRFDRDGAALSGDVALYQAGSFSVASAPDGRHVIIHRGFVGSRQALLGQRHDAAGTPVGASFEVTDPASAINDARLLGSRFDVAMNAAGDFVVSWVQGKATGKAGPLCTGGFGGPRNCLGTLQTQVMARRYAADGTAAAAITVDSVTSLEARILDLGGALGLEAVDPSVALGADGRFAVAWRTNTEASDYLRSYQLKLRQFPPSGNAPLARTVEPWTAIRIPALAFDGQGNIVVAYAKYRSGAAGDVGVWVRRYAGSSSNALGPAVRADVGTNPGQHAGLALAADASGGFVVAWQQQYEGVRMQRYGADGLAIGGNAQVSTAGFFGNSLSLALQGNRMMLTWSDAPTQFGGDAEIYARVYEAP